MASRTRPHTRHVSVRRKTTWDIANFGSPANLTADGSILFPLAFTALQEGLTIVRLRGELIISTSGTSGDSADLAVGIGIATSEAHAVGVTALPSPITDGDWNGWFYHRWCSSISTATVNVSSQSLNFRFDVDNKAMRKLLVGTVMFAVMEMDNEAGTGITASVILNTRVLFKLP